MTYDVVIVGGGPAGLAAALALARARRSTLLLDDGEPRNGASPILHGFVTRDGCTVEEFRGAAHAQLQQYPLLDIQRARAERVDGSRDGYEVRLANGGVVLCRRVLLCTGLEDELPELPGLRELWGKAAFECPYCHGWEVRDKVLGYLTDGDCRELALLLHSWGSHVVVFSGGRPLDPELKKMLTGRDIACEERELARLIQGGGGLQAVELTDGTQVPCEALFLQPRRRHTALVQSLRLELDSDGMVRVTSDNRTSLAGVSAAGDLTGHAHGALKAAADGSAAAHAMHRAFALGE
jgi:thioredoxin reductase